MGDWTVGGNVGFEWVIGKDKFELVDGAGAGKDAGVAVGEMMADASEGLVLVASVERLSFCSSSKSGVELVHDAHGGGCEAGVVDVNMGDDETVLVMSVEDSGIVNRLCHALHGEEVFVVCGFPDAARISASCHVASDLDVVGATVAVMRGKVAIG
jgi:hypothetical protein